MSYDAPIRIVDKKHKDLNRSVSKPEMRKMFNDYCRYKKIRGTIRDTDFDMFEKNIDKVLHDQEYHSFLLHYHQVLLYYRDGGKYWTWMKLNNREYELVKDVPYELLVDGDKSYKMILALLNKKLL